MTMVVLNNVIKMDLCSGPLWGKLKGVGRVLATDPSQSSQNRYFVMNQISA